MKYKTNNSFFKKHWAHLLIILIILLAIPYMVAGLSDYEVTFNQHYIESLDSHYKSASVQDKIKSSLSFYTLGLNSIFNGRKTNDVEFSDPDAMFEYLFDKLPYYSIIYPTEMYHYYQFPLPDREISGNLRLVEIENGKLGMGYFDKENTQISNHKLFGFDDGLRVNQISENIHKVNYNGKSVYFHLNPIWNEEPTKTKLLQNELFISKVRDESGVIFYLVFNEEEEVFYYILDEERRLTENLEEFEESILIGSRTGFAFYNDVSNSRKILIGVNIENIRENNYFDGPFDQVYPLSNIREEIYLAYPYTQYGSGIDIHGNFLSRDSVRVAISPYLDYTKKIQLRELVIVCQETTASPGELYSCLTYEDKRDFHKDSPLFYNDGTLKEENLYSQFI